MSGTKSVDKDYSFFLPKQDTGGISKHIKTLKWLKDISITQVLSYLTGTKASSLHFFLVRLPYSFLSKAILSFPLFLYSRSFVSCMLIFSSPSPLSFGKILLMGLQASADLSGFELNCSLAFLLYTSSLTNLQFSFSVLNSEGKRS